MEQTILRSTEYRVPDYYSFRSAMRDVMMRNYSELSTMPDVHYIAIFDDVVFAFEAENALRAGVSL